MKADTLLETVKLMFEINRMLLQNVPGFAKMTLGKGEGFGNKSLVKSTNMIKTNFYG